MKRKPPAVSQTMPAPASDVPKTLILCACSWAVIELTDHKGVVLFRGDKSEALKFMRARRGS